MEEDLFFGPYLANELVNYIAKDSFLSQDIEPSRLFKDGLKNFKLSIGYFYK